MDRNSARKTQQVPPVIAYPAKTIGEWALRVCKAFLAVHVNYQWVQKLQTMAAQRSALRYPSSAAVPLTPSVQTILGNANTTFY